MNTIRFSKIFLICAIALFCSLVSFGNITDYGTNLQFVKHVLAMDTIFPGSSIYYRSISNPIVVHVLYCMIIALETLSAILCWIGAYKLLKNIKATSVVFNKSKNISIMGLTLGFLTWQVIFMSVGGEWFGMWMSSKWNGITDAFHFFITIIAVMIYVSIRDE